MSLDQIRKEIDHIDTQLTKLLKQRMECSLEVAKIKKAEGLEIYHPAREKEIIDRVSQNGGRYGEYIGEIYRYLMSCSRELQHIELSYRGEDFLPESYSKNLCVKGDIACYGNVGAFTHLALISAFGEDGVNPVFCDSFENVFKAVDAGMVSFGIVPVENSSAGSVSEVYDLLLKYKTFIVGSASMPVKHNLLAIPGADIKNIKTVYSHPQALSQCDEFIKSYGFETLECSSTAAAAKTVAQLCDPTICAIGSSYCARENGLELLLKDIQSFSGNKTRFILLSKTPIIPKDKEKISLVFSLPHTPGSLQRILTRFSLHGLNLTKLESRAGKNGGFETCFYLDFLGDIENEKTKALLLALKTELPGFAFLGNYKEIDLGGSKK